MTDAVAPPPQAIPPHAIDTGSPVTFTGVRGDFRRLVMRGALLELLTFGFYRFWLATDMRRHLWSHTSVGGDAPEYIGTAKELLIGFLVALAILAPVYLAYFFIGIEAEVYQAFASVPLILFFYLFYQFATYRARRYRLSRTIWRGVRFWMKGAGWSYAWRAGLWMLLVVVTLGLALPWCQAALERYKMHNSFYGDLAGRFDGTGGGLFKQVWWVWLVTVLIVAAITAAGHFAGPRRAEVIGFVLVPMFIVWIVFAYAIYKACEWRWWMSGVRFGDVRFESKLSISAFFGLYWKVIGWSWLILFVLIAWVTGVLLLSYRLAGPAGTNAETIAMTLQNAPVLVAIALGYITCALAFGMVVRLYLRRDVWARVVASTAVYNLAAADNVAARGDMVNALGEGFSDGLDIGGF
ncbi:MAG TPA: DUF898 family protein [Xanthobacteraceae bacterium]|nr:DUF898 family protein [Xanthobacteraceae bacterium]